MTGASKFNQRLHKMSRWSSSVSWADTSIPGDRSSPVMPFTLHYITLHYNTIQYITLHYITLHYITLHYITLQ